VLERGEFMLVQRVDYLAVQTLVYTQHQYLPTYLGKLTCCCGHFFFLFYFSFFIANLTHVRAASSGPRAMIVSVIMINQLHVSENPVR